MKITSFVKMPLLALLLVLHSCQNEGMLPDNDREAKSVQIPNHIKNKLQRLGFVVDEFSYPFEDGYIVEGDIIITEEQMDQMLQKGNYDNARHFSTDNLVNVGTSRLIRVWVSPEFNNGMREAAKEALNRYNALSLRMSFEITSDESVADIKILYGSFPHPLILALTGFPSNGNPSGVIYLSRMTFQFLYRDNPPAGTAAVIAHELGHSIGFRHMDYQDRSYSCSSADAGGAETVGPAGANPIAGTGTGNTPNSWMLACGSENLDRPFILTDKIALYNLYGKYRDKGDVFLRYRKGNGGHFYTRYYDELREGNKFFTSQGIMCRMYPNSATGRKPIYRYYNLRNGNHFYTASFSELGNGNSRFRYEGVAGYVFSSNSQDRVPLYRYYNPSKDFHFYTTDYSELGSGANGYRLESILGYTYPNK